MIFLGGNMKFKSIIALSVSVIIAFVFIGIYKLDNTKIQKLDLKQVTEDEIDNVVIKIENVVHTEEYIQIDGWSIDKGMTNEYFNWVTGKDNSVYNNNKVVLRNEENELLGIQTVSKERKDINDKIKDGIDYKKCGVEALVKCSKLKKGEVYKIGILVITLDGKEKLVMSDEEIRI
jgi:hypothetical protein